MVIGIILALCAILSYGAIRSSYYAIKFMAAAAFLSLGIYLIYYPPVAGSNPLNNALLITVFGMSAALLFMPMWFSQKNNGSGEFGLRVPRFLGGQSEEDELAESRLNSRTATDRRTAYRARVYNAMRGRRR